MKKFLLKILGALHHGWKYFWRFFSSDPAVSCSRLLAMGCVVFVGVMGVRHFNTLTDVQSTFLLGFLSGILPYATSKIFEGVGKIPELYKSMTKDTPIEK